MNREKLLQDLQQMKELTPDEYDGSYELVREIVSSYSRMDDYSICDYPYLNAIYALAIGTWKLNPEKKKEYVQKSHLPESEKERIAQTINRIWDNACHERYAHKEGKGPSVGMFGTGFYSFLGMTTPASVQGFIKMIVDINEMEDDIQI